MIMGASVAALQRFSYQQGCPPPDRVDFNSLIHSPPHPPILILKGCKGVTHDMLPLQFLDYVWGPLMEALSKEPDADVQSAHLDTIGEIVELVSERVRERSCAWVCCVCGCVYGGCKGDWGEAVLFERVVSQASQWRSSKGLEMLQAVRP
jgi:hypothetical protein